MILYESVTLSLTFDFSNRGHFFFDVKVSQLHFAPNRKSVRPMLSNWKNIMWFYFERKQNFEFGAMETSIQINIWNFQGQVLNIIAFIQKKNIRNIRIINEVEKGTFYDVILRSEVSVSGLGGHFFFDVKVSQLHFAPNRKSLRPILTK